MYAIKNDHEAAIYCRVDHSDNADARRIALAGQRDLLERYATDNGLTVTGYYEDDGYAGYDTKRPGLKQLITGHAAGAFDAVLVVKLDRLYRGERGAKMQLPFAVISLNPLERECVI